MRSDSNSIDLSFDTLGGAVLGDPAVEMVNQSLWTAAVQPPPRVINLRNAIDAGKRVSASIALNAYTPAMQHVAAGRSGVPDDLWDRIEWVSIDMELENLHVDDLINAWDTLAQMGKNVRVVYTRRDYWNHIGGDPADPRLKGSWLWDARPDGGFYVPYGVWAPESVMGTQTSSTTLYDGIEVDFDFFQIDFLMNGLIALRKAWEDDMADSIAGAASLHNGPINPLAVSLFAVRQQQKAAAWAQLVNPGK